MIKIDGKYFGRRKEKIPDPTQWAAWIGTLAIVVAVIVVVTGARRFIPLLTLLIGLTLVVLATDGLRTGFIQFRRYRYSRHSLPGLFWIVFILYLVAGLVGIVAAVVMFLD